jgi:hypothetical protein
MRCAIHQRALVVFTQFTNPLPHFLQLVISAGTRGATVAVTDGVTAPGLH